MQLILRRARNMMLTSKQACRTEGPSGGGARRAITTTSRLALVLGCAIALPAFAQQETPAGTGAADVPAGALIFFGLVVGTLFYSLLQHLVTRDRSYLHFGLFALGMTVGHGGLSGLGDQLLWEPGGLLSKAAEPAGFAFAGLFATLYTRDFLGTASRIPRIDRIMQALAWIFATIALGAFVIPDSARPLLGVTVATFGVLALTCGLRCRRLSAPGVAFYLIGGTALLGSAVAGTIASTPLSLALMEVAGAAGMLLLSLALTERTSARWRERSIRQADTLSNFEQQLEALKSSEEHLKQALTSREREIEILSERVQDGERRELEMSHLDPLTGLVNHLLLADRIEQGIIRSKRHNTRVATLMVDLNQYKAIRETHGETVANELLKEVAARLRKTVREQDTVARLEDDEFIVVLEEIFDEEDLQRVLNAIESALVEVVRIDELTLHVSASVGAAIYPDGGRNAAALIKQATKLMRRTKGGKRLQRDAGDNDSVAA